MNVAEHGAAQWPATRLAGSSQGRAGSSLEEDWRSVTSGAALSSGPDTPIPAIAADSIVSQCPVSGALSPCGMAHTVPPASSIWRVKEAESSVAMKDRIMAEDERSEPPIV